MPPDLGPIELTTSEVKTAPGTPFYLEFRPYPNQTCYRKGDHVESAIRILLRKEDVVKGKQNYVVTPPSMDNHQVDDP